MSEPSRATEDPQRVTLSLYETGRTWASRVKRAPVGAELGDALHPLGVERSGVPEVG